jgi:hypothetical protein
MRAGRYVDKRPVVDGKLNDLFDEHALFNTSFAIGPRASGSQLSPPSGIERTPAVCRAFPWRSHSTSRLANATTMTY